jgi:dTDP-4-amino-4,6-dideoxygalactose transaminase
MTIPLVDLKAQHASIREELDAAVARVLSNGSFVLGEEVAAFEVAFAKHVGARSAVGVASGTAALRLALAACNIGPGDEVITTPHTFFATAEAISQSGATPVFVDVRNDTMNLDPERVELAVTWRTKAIIPVHLYGNPAAMEPLLGIARRHNLRLIEDAAQAHGAEYSGRRCGSLGDLGCFSFYPGKNLGACGDAGAVTGNDLALLDRVRTLRDHGRTSKYLHNEIGFAERMDALQAAILAVKLAHLEAWTERRREAADRYRSLLSALPLTLPEETPGTRHVFHLYVVRTPGRDALLDHLKKDGIMAGVHYPVPLHRQPAYLNRGYGTLSLPIAERAAREVLSLPLYPELDQSLAERVASSIGRYFS